MIVSDTVECVSFRHLSFTLDYFNEFLLSDHVSFFDSLGLQLLIDHKIALWLEGHCTAVFLSFLFVSLVSGDSFEEIEL